MSAFDDRPTLTRQHVRSAKLWADRIEMLTELPCPRDGVVCEIGVALADLSLILMEQLRPRQFVAFDTFILHELPGIWGRSTAEIFGDLPHETFYRQRMAPFGERVVIERGLSQETVARYPDQYFDLIYIDADHGYAGVKRDAELAARKIRPGGLVVFNDYVGAPGYGVIEAVNQTVVAGGWQVVGFALAASMFCDIAIQRAGQ